MMHRIAGQEPHPHATVAEARECQAEYDYYEGEGAALEAAAEAEAERAYERWLENGGQYAAAIQADLDLDDQMMGRF